MNIEISNRDKELSNRDKEYIRDQQIKKGWKISNRYSKILEKNKASSSIDIIILNTHKQFMNDLKSNNLDKSNKQKYIRCWSTLVNTCNNPKNNIDVVRNALSIFNYTNHLKNI